MNNEDRIKFLEEENKKLQDELTKTREHLKKYTAPASSKIYYENNKEAQKQRVKEYKETTNYKPTTEQKKDYNKTAYLKRKEKLKKLENESKNI